MNPVTVRAAYCVSEIFSVGRCRSVSDAAESSDPDRNGKVAVMRWVYKRGLVDNPRAIVLWDDNESNAAAVRDSEFSIVFVSARGGRAAHAGIQEYDVACFEAASTDGVSDACGHFS